MALDGVEEYLDRSTSLIDSAPQMGEENTKVKLIQPLIELLGWDLFSSEVELEYPIQIGQGHARADYALLLDGSPVVFIEAKGCDTTLSEKNRRQLGSYMRQKGADWGLLTNGHSFDILRREEESSIPKEVSLATFPIEELRANWNVLRLLSRNLIESGEARDGGRDIIIRNRAIGELQSGKEEISNEVAQVVVDRVGDELTQEIEIESKAFVDNLIQIIRHDRKTTGPDEPIPVSNGSTSDEIKNRYVTSLHQDGTEVWVGSADSQADAMAGVMTALIEDHGLTNELDLPYIPGQKKAILNTEPKHPTGEEMRLYRQIADGYFLYVALDKGSKTRYVNQFAEYCGLTVEYNGTWEDS
jgi:predicted type IV restriction endonuclease